MGQFYFFPQKKVIHTICPPFPPPFVGGYGVLLEVTMPFPVTIIPSTS